MDVSEWAHAFQGQGNLSDEEPDYLEDSEDEWSGCESSEPPATSGLRDDTLMEEDEQSAHMQEAVALSLEPAALAPSVGKEKLEGGAQGEAADESSVGEHPGKGLEPAGGFAGELSPLTPSSINKRVPARSS